MPAILKMIHISMHSIDALPIILNPNDIEPGSEIDALSYDSDFFIKKLVVYKPRKQVTMLCALFQYEFDNPDSNHITHDGYAEVWER